MAERYGVTLAAFQKALNRMRIAPKSRGRAGSANGRFIDGTQSTAYRKMVAKDRCAMCVTADNLLIHHMDGVHTNNTPSNLQVLCSPCHSSLHKSEWWRARKSQS